MLGRAVACEPFTEAPVTGSFLVVDAITGTTVAAGTVAEASAKSRRSGTAGRGPEFRLDRSVLARGLCRDIDDTFEGRAEFARRVEEVALLLKAAGIDAVRDGN